MVEVTILIPVADNSGSTFDSQHHIAFERFVLDRFGGLSRSAHTVDGLWDDQGRTYRDTLLVYTVAVQSILDGGKLREVVDFAKEHYRQEAIYLRYLGMSEII